MLNYKVICPDIHPKPEDLEYWTAWWTPDESVKKFGIINTYRKIEIGGVELFLVHRFGQFHLRYATFLYWTQEEDVKWGRENILLTLSDFFLQGENA